MIEQKSKNKINQGLKRYHEKLKQGLITRSKILDPIEKSKLNPKSLRLAINAYCYDCCCEQRLEVKLCPADNCPLHHLRPWQPKPQYPEQSQ